MSLFLSRADKIDRVGLEVCKVAKSLVSNSNIVENVIKKASSLLIESEEDLTFLVSFLKRQSHIGVGGAFFGVKERLERN